jgi:hypothetical protein
MAKLKSRVWVPKKLYDALVAAAKEKHQSLKEYLDELSVHLLFGEFDESCTRKV